MTAANFVVTATCKIAAGTSLSSAADCSAGKPVMIIMPPDWNYAPITFQASYDGINFVDVFRSHGEESVVGLTPGVGYVIPYASVDWAVALKVRSGTRQQPVAQLADRPFIVVLQKTSGPVTSVETLPAETE